MEKILFDSSAHLGQFCMSNPAVRAGCKKSQSDILQNGNGMWTDLENGRVDKTIWALSAELQEDYYRVMDMFFSEAGVQQAPVTDDEMELALALRKDLPLLHAYSRHTCAKAILGNATKIHTLFAELLADSTRSHMERRGIGIVRPESARETPYASSDLDNRFWRAFSAFRHHGLDLPSLIDDPRPVLLT